MCKQGLTFTHDIPSHSKVAGTENGHACMRQGSEEELVETGADVSILPHRERILVICLTEASNQFTWPIVLHSYSYFIADILKI